MEGLRTGVARTEVFRVQPSTFEEAVDTALNAEFNFKAARYGTHGHNSSSVDRAVPKDLSYAESEETELQAVEQQRNIRRCYMCGSTRHLHPNCPLRKQRPNRPSRNPAPSGKLDFGRGKWPLPVGVGRPTGKELGSAKSLGGRDK